MSQSKGNLHSITNQVGRGVRNPRAQSVRIPDCNFFQ